MIFLIEYNRNKGCIVSSRSFDDSQRREAENARLDLELDLNRKGIGSEVVLLEAENEEALHQTHRRYFESLRQILSQKRDMPDFTIAPSCNGGLNNDAAPVQ